MAELFQADAATIETLVVGVAGSGRHFEILPDGSISVGPDPLTRAMANEMLAACQTALRAAYMASCVAPGVSPAWMHVHDPCGSWRLQTKTRSTSVCECGDKTPKRRIVIPWASMNHHGRPKFPHFQKAVPV
ncbi:MAG: hypothetical protein P8O03_03135 [Ilumatobacter sp.]|nr:hypothetical protein [Ilumatobacter sp.]